MYFRENFHTDAAPQAIGPYSQAVRAGDLVFISGQIPLDPVSMELVEGDFRRQVEQVVTNIEAVTSAAGGTLCQVVKVNVYLTDLAKFEVVNEVLDEFFLEPYPARAAVGVSALPKGAEVEMEAIMHASPGES
jgi:reactive intermediate/imine deaminase